MWETRCPQLARNRAWGLTKKKESVGESGVPEAMGENRALRFPTAGLDGVGGAGNILVCRVVRLCKSTNLSLWLRMGMSSDWMRAEWTTQNEGGVLQRLERAEGWSGRLSASRDMERIHYIIGFWLVLVCTSTATRLANYWLNSFAPTRVESVG